MGDVLLFDGLAFRQTLKRPDMTLEALFRTIARSLADTGDPLVTAFHAFRVGAQLGREFPAELERLDREWKRRAERELRERGNRAAAQEAIGRAIERGV